LVDKPLAAAAWVALLLRQPLLLSGDPGVGKTRFAEKLAFDLDIGPHTTIQVKSTTNGRDLLYTFDDLARFRDATIAGAIARQGKEQTSAPTRALISYVRLQGLGRAIVRAAGGTYPVRLMPGLDPIEVFGSTAAANRELTLADVFPEEFNKTRMAPRHTVVLMDELDKAPRDTPNDLLAEIESMEFTFDELGFGVKADPVFKPIVVITTNAERNLPDAFLRRCVFHHIATPSKERMCQIAAARLGAGDLKPDSPLITNAWALFDDAGKRISEKRPGTAEFIALVAYLRAAGMKPDQQLVRDSPLASAALRVITKTKADLATAGPVAPALSTDPAPPKP
jgi:MoxR-like ATPase